MVKLCKRLSNNQDPQQLSNLPFTVKVNCINLIIPITDGLQDLLSTGAMKAAQHEKKTCLLTNTFNSIMDTIEDQTRFATIERTENGAFLFGQHFSKNHVALMLKFSTSDKTLTIEGKSTDALVLKSVMISVCDIII